MEVAFCCLFFLQIFLCASYPMHVSCCFSFHGGVPIALAQQCFSSLLPNSAVKKMFFRLLAKPLFSRAIKYLQTPQLAASFKLCYGWSWKDIRGPGLKVSKLLPEPKY